MMDVSYMAITSQYVEISSYLLVVLGPHLVVLRGYSGLWSQELLLAGICWGLNLGQPRARLYLLPHRSDTLCIKSSHYTWNACSELCQLFLNRTEQKETFLGILSKYFYLEGEEVVERCVSFSEAQVCSWGPNGSLSITRSNSAMW